MVAPVAYDSSYIYTIRQHLICTEIENKHAPYQVGLCKVAVFRVWERFSRVSNDIIGYIWTKRGFNKLINLYYARRQHESNEQYEKGYRKKLYKIYVKRHIS